MAKRRKKMIWVVGSECPQGCLDMDLLKKSCIKTKEFNKQRPERGMWQLPNGDWCVRDSVIVIKRDDRYIELKEIEDISDRVGTKPLENFIKSREQKVD